LRRRPAWLVAAVICAATSQAGCEARVETKQVLTSGKRIDLVAQLRRRFVGRTIYGHGGIGISCPPRWTRVYAPSVPLRILAIEPESSAATVSFAAPYGANIYGPAIVATHALRVIFASPRNAPYGVNYGVAGIAGRCPAIDLSAEQFPTVFSLTAPASGSLRGGLHAGTTRTDVVWRVGYPWEIATREAMLAQPVWHYGVGMAQYDVLFANDIVTAVRPRPPSIHW
jgi:hypothetical protein